MKPMCYSIPMTKTYDYTTTVSEVREGMTVRLPLFPDRLVRVQSIIVRGDTYWLRFDNGGAYGETTATAPITVVSDN